MAKTQVAPPTAFSAVRPGEGVVVELRPVVAREVSGSNATRMSANVSAIPVPSKRYSADVCFVGFSHGTYKWLFAQEKFNSQELRTLIIVKMSAEATVRFLTSCDEASPTFDEFAEQTGIEVESLPKFGEEPKETVAFDANFALVALSGAEACVDFYHSSAFAVGASKHTNKLALDPVVRVDLRSSLLLGMIREVAKVLGDQTKTVYST